MTLPIESFSNDCAAGNWPRDVTQLVNPSRTGRSNRLSALRRDGGMEAN